MRRLRPSEDDGNIMIALLGIIVITSIVFVGMAQMLMSERVTRHDRNFEQALAAAETGLDRLLTQVKAAPFAASATPVSGTDTSTSTSWTATATGGNGHWVLTSTGTATGSRTNVTRTITRSVDVRSLLANPLFATSDLTLGGANSVDTYDSSVDSSVCTTGGLPTSMLTSGTRMCTHASSGALGRIGTDGALTLPHDSLDSMAGADIYATGTPGFSDPLDTGSCAGDSTTCGSSKVVSYPDPLAFPLSSQCASGVGAGAAAYDGSLSLAANAVYSFTNVTLNATAIANLSNVSGSTLVICFSGQLDIVPTVPLNSYIPDVLSPLRLAPRAPSTLILISTSGSPTIRLNAGLSLSSKLSAVIYAPNATCSATAHVDLYGAMVCGALTDSSGIDVHYDTQVGRIPFEQPISVSAWREK